jgi:trigger factor
MQITKKTTSPTELKLTITADSEVLDRVKAHVLRDLAKSVKIQGFRSGKAPLNLVEKSVDPQTLQSEFLDHVINELWGEAIRTENLRPVAQPKVSITKFVPFTTVEADFDVSVVGNLVLPDYKKFRLAKKPVKVEASDVTDVLNNLRNRAAEKKEVTRAAKDGDEVTIDFFGTDAKTKEPIDGADGKDYDLVLGSNSFIPGFEPELIGLKPGDEKTFLITFPKDYSATELQNRKVNFAVTVHKVKALTEPKLDDAFAATVGPFTSLAELKADIKKQLTTERETQARRDYESELLEKLAEKTEVAIPTALIDEEIDRQEADERQNLTYRGQTWQEHLDSEGINEKQHREKNRPGAELRVKAGLLLSEIAEAEGIVVTPEELNVRIQLYKGQYTDPKMISELEKPDSRREIMSRLLSEKTIDKLAKYATAK